MTGFFDLRPGAAGAWDDLVARADRYDFYHTAGYHALAEARGEGAARLFVAREGDDFVALPLLLRPLPPDLDAGRGLFDATSVYGYAGPVASRRSMPGELVRAFQTALAAELARRRVVTVFSRLHPLLEQRPLLAGLGEQAPAGRTVAIDLTLPEEAQRAGVRNNHLRDLKKLERAGLRCLRDGELRDLPAFRRLYRQTMERLGAAAGYFFDDRYFDRLMAIEPRPHLFVCRADGEVACAGIFFLTGGILQCHLSGTASKWAGRSPLKLLLDGARRWGIERGARVFHLGGGVGGAEDSLFHFKRGFSPWTLDFEVWRWVLDGEVYQELCGRAKPVGDFFPRYRSS